MNEEDAKNDFQVGLTNLLAQVDRELSPTVPDPYAAAGGPPVQEHTTRVYFLDKLVELLGWHLGLHGDVGEEVRLKAETTTFMDYLGVNKATRAPALLVEAKPWGTPFIANRRGTDVKRTPRELLVATIEHIRTHGPKNTSPATDLWYDFLEQVHGYVYNLKRRHGHALPRAVLTSGDWIVIFKTPIEIFLEGEVNDEQFVIVKKGAYVERAREIFDLLSQSKLAGIVPFSLRPSQLRDYVTADTISAVFYGLHVTYESSGSELFDPQPRILVYPAVIIQRDDDTLITAIDGESRIVMDMEVVGDASEKSLAPHLRKVSDSAAALLKKCSDEVQMQLEPCGLSDFPGFPDLQVDVGELNHHRQVVRPLKTAGDEWLLATGTLPHYLKERPEVHPCRFHAWANCREEGSQIGTSAVNTPRTATPRSFFVDTQIYHCAHQTVQDRRHSRCHIAALDQRTCCRACVYEGLCWPPTELRQLPCGA